jgi:nucleotide-binding universal stress UspA family protein
VPFGKSTLLTFPAARGKLLQGAYDPKEESAMPEIKKVLFPTDFSEMSNHALPYALRMAKIFDAELVMLHAVTVYEKDPNEPTHDFPSLERYCAEVRKAAEDQIQICIGKAGASGVNATKAIVQGISPHGSILDFVKEDGQIGMIVMSTHGHSGLAHVLLGSVTENVIRYSPCPVLVVKRPEHEFVDPETGELYLKKILFPIDFSKDSLHPIDLVRAIASRQASEVILFHAIDVEFPPMYYGRGLKKFLEVDSELHDSIMDQMQEMAGKELEGLKVRYAVQEGKPVELIRGFARSEQIDLIAMGAAGAHGVGEFLFGSTTARVIQKAVCPVLIV